MYTQKNLRLKIFTPLGEDTLLLRRLHGTEALSSLFHFNLELVSLDAGIAASSLLGKPVTVGLSDAGKQWRYINGYVRRFTQGARDARGLSTYFMEVVPWYWFLTQMTDCRIYQNMSVQDILSDVFTRAGYSGRFKFSQVSRGTDKRVYCVQYRETWFNFTSRLMEEEGIFYYFEHKNGDHKLVMADKTSALEKCPNQDIGYFSGGHLELKKASDLIHELRATEEVRSDRFAHTAYNMETPRTSLMAEVSYGEKLEIYDYPGPHLTASEGDAFARVRMEEQQGWLCRLEGSGNCRHFTPGYTYTLMGWEGSAEPQQVIVSVNHNAGQAIQPDGTEGGGEDSLYNSSFTSVPVSAPLRPARKTPRPHIHGSQTATVVGKKGEEIWTDSYGRVKVQFHWDREGKRDEASSCWLRVSQGWAGRNWGTFFLPRIGQEVVVTFLEGDPDQPLVTGCVYNAHQMPPYELPSQQTQMVIKSSSSLGGKGHNELRFEDKAGSEQIFLRAQRNLDQRVLANMMTNVGGSQHLSVGGVDKDGNPVGDQRSKIFKDHHLLIKGDSRTHVEKKSSLIIDGESYIDVKKNFRTTVTSESHLKAETVIIEAGTGVTIKGPGGFINWDSAGITIVGTMVKINSGGSPLTSAISDKAEAPEAPTAATNTKSGKPSNT